MRIKNSVIILLLALVITSCVDSYWPEITDYENILVVDGLLTNGDDPCKVNLSLSNSITSDELIPVSGGILYLSNEEMEDVLLTETDPGVYQIIDSAFSGKVGTSYQLHIELPNGNVYESDMCKMEPPTPIDSVYGILETKEESGYSHTLQGVQFYLDNHSEVKDTCYYLWKLSQTYKYRASFTLDYIWAGEMITVSNPDSLITCWRTKPVNSFYTYSTKYIDQPVINKFPLNYTTTETKMLSVRYSLLVNQLSISETAFEFWDALRQQNLSNDNLYTQQPVQIRGNIRNIMNEDEVVLGYFTVAGVAQKRIFINRPSVLTFYYTICDPDFESMIFVGASPPTFWPIYITNVPGKGNALGGSDVCFDCRLEGGELTPPDFWED